MQWRNPTIKPNSSPVTEPTHEETALSISDQRTLYLVNIFIADTARFLNRFSAICEYKLADVHRRILRLRANLTLLEAKLNSIDGIRVAEEGGSLESEESSLLQQQCKSPDHPACGSGEPSSGSINIYQETSMSSVQSEGSHVLPSIPDHHLSMNENDPRLSKFRRMLHFGVPQQAVKMQMGIEGMDPALFNNLGRS